MDDVFLSSIHSIYLFIYFSNNIPLDPPPPPPPVTVNPPFSWNAKLQNTLKKTQNFLTFSHIFLEIRIRTDRDMQNSKITLEKIEKTVKKTRKFYVVLNKHHLFTYNTDSTNSRASRSNGLDCSYSSCTQIITCATYDAVRCASSLSSTL